MDGIKRQHRNNGTSINIPEINSYFIRTNISSTYVLTPWMSNKILSNLFLNIFSEVHMPIGNLFYQNIIISVTMIEVYLLFVLRNYCIVTHIEFQRHITLEYLCFSHSNYQYKKMVCIIHWMLVYSTIFRCEPNKSLIIGYY